ncbi:hypothetical protein Q5P01_008513 [Channa striata]|uniref:Ig-like domain-containing protein n=1 Tax=Channa striata TaxID=64152 RepID=A0AA88N585_CHASR|nr:hypothetical protein Q5P01_008513 [Channa striata]
MTFLKGTFLRIKGPESDVVAVTQDPSPDPVHPGDSVSLQCSVLSDSENKTCPEEHSVYWFRSKSDESHLSLIYANGNSDQCEKSPDSRKCVYHFFKEVGPSDAGTYYCAVASCGKILFGNGTKLDIEVVSTCDLQCNTIQFVLCVSLAISLIVIAILTYAIMKNKTDFCKAATDLKTNAATPSGNQPSQQRNEESLVYSTAIFTRREGAKAGRRNAAAKDETVYTDVRTFVTH